MSDGNDRTPDASAGPQPAAQELARQLIDGAAVLPENLEDSERRSLAWALKEACYAAWSSEPRRAAGCAGLLALLGAYRGVDRSSPLAREIAALAEWTEGIAQLAAGRMAEAVAGFDAAAAIFRDCGLLQRAAETQVPKIMALSMLGRHAAAAECAEATRRDFLAAGDLRAAAKASLNLGNVLHRQASYAKAARNYREAVVLFARVGDMEHSVMADIDLGSALAELGEFDEALRTHARAAMRAETHGFPVLAAMVEEWVGLLHLVRGRYREALAGLEGSRQRYEHLALPQHLAVAEKQLADAYRELRLLPEALALYEKALRAFEHLGLPQEQAWTLLQLGRTHSLMEKPSASNEALLRASELFENQGNLVGGAAIDLARAELALAQGQSEPALELATRAARAYEAASLPEGNARSRVVQAQALFALGQADAARSRFTETLALARARELLSVQWRCLSGVGLLAASEGDAAGARAAFEAATELFEDQRRALPGDEIRSAFLSDHLVAYRELLRLALADHDAEPTEETAGEVLRGLERIRARSWSDRIAGVADAESSPEVSSLRARVNWLYRKLRRAQGEGAPTQALLADLRQTERDLLEDVRRGRLRAATPGASPVPAEDFSIGPLRRAISPDEALVEYGVVGDELFACVVASDGVHVRRALAKWTEVAKTVQSARFQIETLRFGTAPVAGHESDLVRRARIRMQQLYAQLWAPLRSALARYRRIVVVPHGQLGTIPFGALHDGERYLAEILEIAIAPSARIALHGLSQRPAPPKRVLAIGDSSTLEHAEREVCFVARLFPEGEAFSGEQATVATIQSRAGAADVLHLACHAQFRPDSPMFSALHLRDGALTVEAVEGLSLRAGVVVLSACETGLAEVGSGDEMVGLVRAFLLAGASRVVASLWPVDDAATVALMTHFYSALRAGTGAAQALFQSQNAVMQQRAHPFHWAGFCLYGGF